MNDKIVCMYNTMLDNLTQAIFYRLNFYQFIQENFFFAIPVPQFLQLLNYICSTKPF